MAISFVNRGTEVTGSTSVAPGIPASVVSGDLLLLCVNHKASATPSAPAGWTLVDANTTHPVGYRTIVFAKTATGSDTAPTVSGLTSSSTGVIVAYRGVQIPGALSTLSVGHAAGLSVTSQVIDAVTDNGGTSTAKAYTAGDWVVWPLGSADDSWPITSPAVAVQSGSGAVGAVNRRTTDTLETTTGTDNALTVFDNPITTSGTAVLRLTYTQAVAAANSGPILRLTPLPDPPNAPTGLTATGDADSINLSWTAPASGTTPTSYNVYRQGPTGDNATFTGGVGGWTAINSDVTVSHNNTDGRLVVTMTTTLAASGATSPVSDKIPVTPGSSLVLNGQVRASVGTRGWRLRLAYYTSADAFISLGGTTASSGSSSMTAVTVTDTVPATAAYAVVRFAPTVSGSIGDAGEADNIVVTSNIGSTTAPTTTYDDTTAVSGVTYTYTVRAVNAGGESPDSNSDSESWTLTAPFSDDFSSGSWRAGYWTTSSPSSSSQWSATVVGGVGRLISVGVNVVVRADVGLASMTDAGILVKVVPPGNGGKTVVVLRAGAWDGSSAAAVSGYGLTLNADGTGFAETFGGATVFSGLTLPSAPFWVRFEAIGSALYLRMWEDGLSEPGTWTRSNTSVSSPPTSGTVKLASQATTSANDFSAIDDVYVYVPAASSFTGTAAQTLPSFTQAAAGTFTPSTTFTGSAAQTLPAFTQAATGTRTVPTRTGTAASTMAAVSQSAAGTRTIPAFTGSASSTLPAFTQSAAGTRTIPAFTGSAGSTLPAFTQSAAGKVHRIGTASQTLPAVTQSAAGSVTVATRTGTAASTLAALTQEAAGTRTVPTSTGTAAQTLPALSQTASGTRSVPVSTGTATSTLAAVTQSATGTSAVPVFTGSSAQTLPALTQTATGTRTIPAFTGAAASVLPAFTQAAEGSRTIPVFTGSASSTLPALTQAATGTSAVPVFTGTAASSLAAVEQSAAGIFAPARTGTAAQTLPAFTQEALGTSTVPQQGGEVVSILPSVTQSAEGTRTVPTSTGTATSALSAVSQAASGTAAVPAYTGTGSSTLPALTTSATGTSSVPVFTGTAASALPSLTQTAEGSRTVPVQTGTASSSLPALTQQAQGNSAAALFTGTATSTLSAFTQTATGTNTLPTWTGTAASTLPAVQTSAEGVRTIPERTGTATSGLPALTQQASGQLSTPTSTGAAASTLPALSQQAEGTFEAFFTGLVESVLPALSQTATGTRVVPVFSGTAVTVLAAFTQAAAGRFYTRGQVKAGQRPSPSLTGTTSHRETVTAGSASGPSLVGTAAARGGITGSSGRSRVGP